MDTGKEQISSETSQPIDLRLRRLAREMEAELGGLFGIDYKDIERALDRLHAGLEGDARTNVPESGPVRLPEPIERVLPLLDIIYEIAHHSANQGDRGAVQALVELLENYRGRIEKLEVKERNRD